MARCRHVIASIVAVASLAWTVDARAAVVFVDENPPAVELQPGAEARVELLNAGRSDRRLSLRVVGGPDGEIAIAAVNDGSAAGAGQKPAGRVVEGVAVAAGSTQVFTVKLASPPSEPVSRSLLASSSDGTVARLALKVGEADDTPISLPKSLDIGIKEVGDSATIGLVGVPEVEESSEVGRLHDASRHQVKVTLEPKRKVTVTGAPAPGTYSGEIDVNGAADGGTSTFTVRARDGWLKPLFWLLFGIAVGYVIEWWLTRLRPRALLDRRLARLMERLGRRQQRVDDALHELFADSRPEGIAVPADRAWRVPRVTTDVSSQVSRYYLSRVGMELTRSLKKGRTDPERELFGPDGDAFKGLLTDEDTYAQLVGDLREAAATMKPSLIALRNVGHVPMRVRLDYECRTWVIGDKQTLAAKREAAKGLREAAEAFAEYRRRLQRAETLADGTTFATKLTAHRRLLEDTFRGDDDQVAWWDDALAKLEGGLDVGAGADLPKQPIRTDRAPSDPPGLLPAPTPHDPAPETPHVVPNPPWSGQFGSLRDGKLTAWEWVIGALSLVIIAASGLSLLYVEDSTFGSFGDYLSLALWGSTATAGLALLRRLFPGALKTAQAG